jgi:farnesyl-diphosphate farnesyltransferase|tara:strand:- start:57 stop:257 length:201 start_codon:yes stop_codon:yes gene_type:complete
VAGLVGEGLSRLFASSSLERPSLAAELHLSDQMGLFLQKTNIIRDYLEDYVDGRAFWPKEVWEKYR